jgi:large subunit ribosomal protein L25
VSDYELAIEVREGSGKGVARKLRAAGRIPGVCYGGGEAPRSIQLDPHALDRVITRSAAGVNTLIDLKGGGLDGKVVLVKELQRDPVRGTLLHADLYTIDVDRTVEVEVPIHLTGLPVGVELGGGILEHTLRELELECLPRAIPEEITLDVTALELGESLHVRDLALPEGVTLVSDPDLSVVSVAAPRAEEEPTVEGAEEAAAEGAEEGEGAAKEEGADAEGGDADKKKDD